MTRRKPKIKRKITPGSAAQVKRVPDPKIHSCKSLLTPQMIAEAEDLVGKLGATNKYLALYFNVNITTIENWIQKNEDFCKAVKRGRIVCGMKVARSLYTVATGYEIPAEKIFQYEGMPIRVPYMKYYPPNPYAAKQWLSIMFKDLGWSETNINVQHTGEIQHTHTKVEELDLDKLSEPQKELLMALNLKQIADAQHN